MVVRALLKVKKIILWNVKQVSCLFHPTSRVYTVFFTSACVFIWIQGMAERYCVKSNWVRIKNTHKLTKKSIWSVLFIRIKYFHFIQHKEIINLQCTTAIFAVKFGKSLSIAHWTQSDSLSRRREVTRAVSIKTGTVYRSRSKDRFGEKSDISKQDDSSVGSIFFVSNRIYVVLWTVFKYLHIFCSEDNCNFQGPSRLGTIGNF